MSNRTNHLLGEAHPGWKGSDVGYSALHQWVREHRVKPAECQHCGSTERLDWANVSGEYRRDLTDWIALCRRCHRALDRKAVCRTGHERTEANTVVDRRGIKKCRTCKNEAWRRRYYERVGREVPA